MTRTGTPPEAYATYMFKVSIGGQEVAIFTECTGPSLEMEVYEYQEGGLNSFVHRLPGRWKVGNITLKHGITKSDYLWKWCQKAVFGALEPKNVSVTLCHVKDGQAETMMAWNFRNAYPVKWSSPTFKADENAIAIGTLELAHEG